MSRKLEWTKDLQTAFDREKDNHITLGSLALAIGVSPSTLRNRGNAPIRLKLLNAVAEVNSKLQKETIDKMLKFSEKALDDRARLEALKSVLNYSERQAMKIEAAQERAINDAKEDDRSIDALLGTAIDLDVKNV